MKKFTIKDFINFNSPCFSCNSKISVRIGVENSDMVFNEVYLRPTVGPSFLEVDLKITYNSHLKLIVAHKTNKFAVNDIGILEEYFKDHKIFIETECSRCYTKLESQNLEFDWAGCFIRPVEMKREILMTSDDHNLYQIFSSFPEKTSLVVIDKISKATPISPIHFSAPLLPLYKFRDKKHLIEKLKTYALFS